MKKLIYLILIISFGSFLTFGQTTEKEDIVRKKYKATRTETAPDIDGILNEELWNIGIWENEFTQNRPYDGRPSKQRTEFKILFDDINLYVGIKCFDTSPDSIVNRLTRRDQADGDLAGVIIDSFHDLRTGFVFGVSSSGVKYDMLMSNDGSDEDNSLDPNWWVKTSINEEGWIAEMKIPFSQIRFDKNSGDVWI